MLLFHTELEMHLCYERIMANRNRLTSREIILTHLGPEMLERLEEIQLRTAFDGLTLNM